MAATFDFWTATSSGDPLVFGQWQGDYYNLLTDGFASGHLYASLTPSSALLALPNPYDPAEAASLPNADVPHDLSLYHGHFYLSWGPTPVLTLLWPYRLLHIGQLPQNGATLVYALVGLALMLATLELLAEENGVDRRRVFVGGLLLAFASGVPYLLRRPFVYEVALSAAYCFTAGALYLLTSLHFGRGSPRRRAALCGLCLALAVGARIELLVLAIPGAFYALIPLRRRAGLAAAFWLIIPIALGAAVLGWYNWARFGNPLQVGSLYQLEGYNPKTTPFFLPGYLPPSLYYYLFAPVRPLLSFPYLALSPPPAYPFGVPRTYAPEVAGGLLFAAPFVLIALVAPFALRHRREGPLVGWLAGSAALVLLALSASVPGATERYEVDFSSLLLLAALVTLFAVRPRRRLRRWLLGILVGTAAAWACLVGVAVSITGPNDELRTGNAASYRTLQGASGFLPLLATRLAGHADIVRVIDPLAQYPDNLGEAGTTGIGQRYWYASAQGDEIDVVSPGVERVYLQFRVNRTSASLRSGRLHVFLADGDGSLVTARFQHRLRLQLVLRPGLNRLVLSATSARPLVPGGLPYVVKIHSLRLVRMDR